MNREFKFKEQFSVIGKLGKGGFSNPSEWIGPIWNDANSNFSEIEPFVKKNENGVMGVWGIMSDFDETFARWDDNGGKYLACCEVKDDAIPPVGWVKWTVPSQTYLVAQCSQGEYLTVFQDTINDYIPSNQLTLIGAVHEHYIEPGNSNRLELYFPIAKGQYFCQSCGMPMNNKEDRGTELDQSVSEDYCQYCYQGGKFPKEETMEEMIESCIPFVLEAGVYPDDKTAREGMLSYFPSLKRWKSKEGK